MFGTSLVWYQSGTCSCMSGTSLVPYSEGTSEEVVGRGWGGRGKKRGGGGGGAW